MKAKTAKEVLIAARWIIENVGWCQNAYYKDANGETGWNFINPPVSVSCACASGAIYFVEADSELHVAALNILFKNIPPIGTTISGWNDQPGRTKKQVLAAFNKAIKATK